MTATTITPTSFGAQVRAARRAKDLTQIQLGRMIGRSGHIICALEKAYREATPEERQLLTEVLKLPRKGVA